MNIVFLNDFEPNNRYSAFDNIIIEFGLDSQPASDIYEAEIEGLDFPVKLSPSPQGVFYFNFKVYSKSYLTEEDLQDRINYNTDLQDGGSLTKQDDFFFDSFFITIKIILDDDTIISKNTVINFLRAVKDNERFFKYLFIEKDSLIEYIAPTIYYFNGYPLDIGVFSNQLTNIGLSNNDNPNDGNSVALSTYQQANNYQFARVILSNGETNIKSTNGNDLIQNMNAIYITDFDEVDFAIKIFNLKKIEHCGGHYLKWLNRSGDFSYFLFSNKHEQSIKASDKGKINNDFNNKKSTVSRYLSKGKTSKREMRLFKQSADEEMRYFLSDLIDSPRVYYYTGERGQAASDISWIEVNVTDSDLELQRPKENKWDFYLEIEFPEYKNQVI